METDRTIETKLTHKSFNFARVDECKATICIIAGYYFIRQSEILRMKIIVEVQSLVVTPEMRSRKHLNILTG